MPEVIKVILGISICIMLRVKKGVRREIREIHIPCLNINSMILQANLKL